MAEDKRPELIKSPYVVDQTTPGFAEFYNVLESLIPYYDSTTVWQISPGGSGKTTHGQALALKLKASQNLQENINKVKQSGRAPHWEDYITVMYESFDMNLNTVAAWLDVKDWRTLQDTNRVFNTATYLMGYRIRQARRDAPKPNVIIADIPGIPHMRETGRAMMRPIIQLKQDNELDVINGYRPDRPLREYIWAKRRAEDQTAKSDSERVRASGDLSERAFNEQLNLIDLLILQGELPKIFKNFRDDPEVEDMVIEALHFLEGKKALGENARELIWSFRNAKLDQEPPSFRHLFEGPDSAFSLGSTTPEEVFGPEGLAGFEKAIRNSPPWLRIFMQPTFFQKEEAAKIQKETIQRVAEQILVQLVYHGKRTGRGTFILNYGDLMGGKGRLMFLTEEEKEALEELRKREILRVRGASHHPIGLRIIDLEELHVEARDFGTYL